METTPLADTRPLTARAARTLELIRAAERVLHEMNTDLSLAEAKLARTRELMARRREDTAATA